MSYLNKKLIYLVLMSLYLMSSQLYWANDQDKLYSFKIGNCILSSTLHPKKQDTSIAISHKLLENLISKELKKSGIDPIEGSRFVTINGTEIVIVGKYDFININLKMDFRFYQKKKQKNQDEMFFDFIVSFDRPNKNFLSNLLDLVTLPVGVVYQSVFTVVFAATKVSVDEMSEYFVINSQGEFNPLTILKKIGASFLNVLLPRNLEINVEHVGTASLVIGPKLKKILSKVNHLEIGSGTGKYSNHLKVISY